MTDFERIKLTRRAHRGQMTKLLQKAEGVCGQETISQECIDILSATVDAISRKLDFLLKLDAEINALIKDDEDFVSHTIEADDYAININERLVKFRNFLHRQSNPPQLVQDQSNTTLNTEYIPLGHKKVNLPKLSLRPYDGNILEWQSFIDSFNAAVHNDQSLDNVQKFQYLKANVTGEAVRTIEGLTLTNENYDNALELLTKRYGQKHKIINAYMKALWELPKPSYQLHSLRNFSDSVETYIRGLSALGKSEESYGDLLVPIIVEKLPSAMRKQIARENGSDEWTLNTLRDAIAREVEATQAGESVSSACSLPHSTAVFQSGEREPAVSSFVTTNKSKVKPSPKCAFCKGNHKPADCNIISDAEKRLQVVKRDHLCFNCLGNHRVSDCRSRYRCQVCKRKHHTALCNPRKKDSPEKQNCTSEQNDTEAVHTCTASTPELPQTPVLLKTAVTEISSDTVRADVTLLFDEGAQRSFITENIAHKLKLDLAETQTVNVAAFGGKSDGVRSLKVAHFTVKTIQGPDIDVRALVVPTISAPLQNHVTPELQKLTYFQGLTLAHPASDADSIEISVLIGADYYWSFVGDHIVRGPSPTAVSSKLGYLLSGPVISKQIPYLCSSILHVNTHVNEETDLQKFWDIESIGIKGEVNSSEITIDNYVKTHITYDQDKYIARFPWKQDHAPLPSNHSVCQKRTRSMVRRLTPELRETYDHIIQDQLDRGFIELAEDECIINGHFLPHHPVKKDSATTPIRIVYDCSCKVGDNPSLSDCLETGPPLLNDLVSILLRFRAHKYAISADIEKAFLNIGLDEQDRQYTKFLWLADHKDPESPFRIYQFRVILFGAVCSPFILNTVVRTHLEKICTAVSLDMKKSVYVDNILSGADSDTEIMNYYQEANAIMKSSGFNLRSWASNYQGINEQAAQCSIDSEDTIVNVLGMKWDTANDLIQYDSKKLHPTPQDWLTKREVLKATGSLYDPLGYLSPLHVKAKLFVQKLWKQNVGWDERLPNHLREQWQNISENLIRATTDCRVKRAFLGDSNSGDGSCELHVFGDASENAYGAVVYLRRDTSTAIVMAKSRVAPVKTMTIPRLELMAALIAARVVEYVHLNIDGAVDVKRCVLWSDSQIVLHWIKSNKKLPSFVENRVKEIKSYKIDEFKYCPTAENPADLISRGAHYTDLADNSLWWNGPHWLQEGDWPICDIFDTAVCSQTQELNLTQTPNIAINNTVSSKPTTNIAHIINPEHYSSCNKVLRVTAYVNRFVTNRLNKRENRKYGQLTAREIQSAESVWIKDIQASHYSDEIRVLGKKSRKLGNLSRQLRLFLDHDRFIRVGGRLHNAPLEYETKFPILLPKHAYTSLIVEDAHSKVSHAGLQSTITYIRQRFWIPKIRQYVKSALRQCVTCKRISGKPYSPPIPAPLQASRLLTAPPFTVTGVDFTGALYVTSDGNDTASKVYVCLFTCAVTRAIHLELVRDLSTKTFLRAFRRFAARRSLPQHMISDNASTYLSAAEELKRVFESRDVNAYLANRRVEWTFIPKRAPWFGGFWERLIGITKLAIKKVLGRSYVTYDELYTILTEIEASINDRPLTYVSTEADDPPPLTPSHLLCGRALTAVPNALNLDELNDPTYGLINRTELQRRADRLIIFQNHFWNRWSHDYLSALRERDRISGKGLTSNSVSEGDVVIVHNDFSPRVQWQLAKVEKLVVGNDGLVRSVIIKTANGRTNRPITKLYPLEINSSDELSRSTSDVARSTTAHAPRDKPTRVAAERARQKIKEWSTELTS